MEVKGGHDNKSIVLFFEFIGTATLLTAINLGGRILGGQFTPIAIGLTIFANIIFLGQVSGGHFNPAVTVAVLIREGSKNLSKNFPYAVMIIFAELLGAVTGVIITFLSLQKDDENSTIYPGITLLCPGRADSASLEYICDGTGYLGKIFLVEAIVTFLFISVIMTLKYDNVTSQHLEAAFAVGAALVGMISVSAGLSGGCLNPAVGTVQSIFQFIIMSNYPATFNNKPPTLNCIWVYILAPLTGGIMAGLFSHFHTYNLQSLKAAQSRAHQEVELTEVSQN